MDDSLRETDWNHSKQCSYRFDDFELFMNSLNLFAGKFSIDVDQAIIDLICEKVVSRQN